MSNISTRPYSLHVIFSALRNYSLSHSAFDGESVFEAIKTMLKERLQNFKHYQKLLTFLKCLKSCREYSDDIESEVSPKR